MRNTEKRINKFTNKLIFYWIAKRAVYLKNNLCFFAFLRYTGNCKACDVDWSRFRYMNWKYYFIRDSYITILSHRMIFPWQKYRLAISSSNVNYAATIKRTCREEINRRDSSHDSGFMGLCVHGISWESERGISRAPEKPLSVAANESLLPMSLVYPALFAGSVSNLWIAIPAPVFYPAWAWPITEWSRTPALLCVSSGSPQTSFAPNLPLVPYLL